MVSLPLWEGTAEGMPVGRHEGASPAVPGSSGVPGAERARGEAPELDALGSGRALWGVSMPAGRGKEKEPSSKEKNHWRAERRDLM